MKSHLTRFAALFSIATLVACSEAAVEVKLDKFSGVVTGTNAAGITLPLADFSFEVELYENELLVNEPPAVSVTINTDAKGRYVLPVERGYKSYSINNTDGIYRSCAGAVSPYEIPAKFEIKSKNENNLTLCIVSTFRIVANKDLDSEYTINFSYLPKVGSTSFLIPGKEITGTEVFDLQFFSAVTEVVFTIHTLDDGVIINTETITKIPVPGSIEDIHINF